ncbi:MAG TPA: Gfo/Idh/MocA family oxidoreductase [Patescibacteria group bacterium]|nr:Gfo/Idh/MocA family oxidoreductase [Patescibacteria group bacterium]
MNENESNVLDFNRRDFLKGGSAATLMTMLGGVELLNQTTNASAAEEKSAEVKMKIGLIGLGTWGREILNTLAVVPEADVAAICDTYAASVRRAATTVPKATQTPDYKTILQNTEIKAVVVATPTHQHKEIVLEALKAGKHVYCEAPLASTIEDAKAIATAGKAAKQQVFQAGLQLRADPQRHFLVPFIRSGAIGKWLSARAQFQKKQSWRATSPKPEREKELNWRLNKATSSGLVGEMGVHPIDQATWFINSLPTAVSGFGTLALWTDGRDVPDTVQANLEFPGGVIMTYNATLANSFDGEYSMFYGTDSAVMLRESKAWLFKEVDSPLLGWEVYASKEVFYKETGIVLKANASKSVAANAGTQVQESPYSNTPLFHSLQVFLKNGIDVTEKKQWATNDFGAEDTESIAAEVAKVPRRSAAGYLEGYQSAVTAIKANEAILSGQRIALKPEWYELG